MNNTITITEGLKSYLDEIEILLKRMESDINENEMKEITRKLNYYKIILIKRIIDL